MQQRVSVCIERSCGGSLSQMQQRDKYPLYDERLKEKLRKAVRGFVKKIGGAEQGLSYGS